MNNKSLIVQDEYMEYCMICGKPTNTIHHVIEGISNRRISDKEKLVVPLCPEHHNTTDMSVHFNNEMKTLMHITGQLAWMLNYVAKQSEIPFYDLVEEARSEYRKKFGKTEV